MLNIAQFAAIDFSQCPLIVGGIERLHERSQQHALFLGGLDQILTLIVSAGQGFFNHHIQSVAKQVLGNGVMHFGICGIDYQINVVELIQFFVIGKSNAAGVDLFGDLPTISIRIHHIFDIEENVVLATVKKTVNILAAAALTNDG